VRRFSVEYLRATREGMWADSREALGALALADRAHVLDVGAGTGELTRVLREETEGEVTAIDADPSLLSHVERPCVVGDAMRLPFVDGAFDLVVCQALLINLPEPLGAVQELARVSSDRVAVIEPDNSAVSIESTVESEPALARRARELYLEGLETDAALGAVPALFESAGLTDVEVRRYDHEHVADAPYTERALESARRKASGVGIETDRETILAGVATEEQFDGLRQEWRAMGREVIAQMRDGTYHQREVVPFYVTAGRVGTTGERAIR